MAARSGLFLSFVVVILAQMTLAHITLDCFNLLFCGGKTPVCSSNGTHCWLADSDCERTKLNCQLFLKKDFDKVETSFCHGMTVGGIVPCCIPKSCPNRKDPICGQTTRETISTCKLFRNRCEMENVNCGNETTFQKVDRALCNFEFNSGEQNCTTV